MRLTWAALLAALMLPAPSTAHAAGYYLMLGNKVARFDHVPVITLDDQTYLTLALLDELGLRQQESAATPPAADAQDEQPVEHYAPDDPGTEAPTEEEVEGQATSLLAPPTVPATAAVPRDRVRYRLADHTLDVMSGGSRPLVQLDGVPVASGQLRRHGGRDYLSSAELSRVGLRLAYNAQEELYQVVGLIHRVSYERESSEVSLACLTPVAIEGVQVDDQRLTVVVDGGFLADAEAREDPGDPLVTKLGFKSQPELGRSFVFIQQPRRSGFKVQADEDVGFARVRFGNYFQVASYQRSSSGELAVVVQLGASCVAQHSMLSNPPRVVVDFPGVVFEDATLDIPVATGSVQRIRVGRPEPGTARVVLDLTESVDYRVMSKDNDSRYYIQLLPRTPVAATSGQLRVGRTIMIDPGHGGSDPGAEGALAGVWEAQVNLEISRYLIEELRGLGYEVLTTRAADRFVSLGARADYANRVLPYLFVSVHCNSIEKPGYTGAMTFHHPASSRGTHLAHLIQGELLAATGAEDKGVRDADFFVLRETVMPSVLVECGFLTHGEECQRLIDANYQRRVAEGIARGIDRYITGQ